MMMRSESAGPRQRQHRRRCKSTHERRKKVKMEYKSLNSWINDAKGTTTIPAQYATGSEWKWNAHAIPFCAHTANNKLRVEWVNETRKQEKSKKKRECIVSQLQNIKLQLELRMEWGDFSHCCPAQKPKPKMVCLPSKYFLIFHEICFVCKNAARDQITLPIHNTMFGIVITVIIDCCSIAHSMHSIAEWNVPHTPLCKRMLERWVIKAIKTILLRLWWVLMTKNAKCRLQLKIAQCSHSLIIIPSTAKPLCCCRGCCRAELWVSEISEKALNSSTIYHTTVPRAEWWHLWCEQKSWCPCCCCWKESNGHHKNVSHSHKRTHAPCPDSSTLQSGSVQIQCLLSSLVKICGEWETLGGGWERVISIVQNGSHMQTRHGNGNGNGI